MNWQDKFQPHILERGCYYTYNVNNFKRDNNQIEAIVSGSEDYTVKINLDDYSMSCTCPYFKKANCKHLATVLFYIDENDREEFYVDVEDSEDIENVFDKVSSEDKLNFLLKILKEDSELSNRFRMEFSNDVDSKYYKNKLSDILLEDDFDRNLSRFIGNEMELLYSLEKYDLLVELIKESSESILNKLTFDSYYDGPNFYSFEDILKKLITTPVRCKIFELITWQLTYYTNHYYSISLIEFYKDNFTNEDELIKKITAIDEILEKSPVYEKEFVLMKIDTMKRLNMSLDDINEFRMHYHDLNEIKQQYIDEALVCENYDLAIDLIEKRFKSDYFARKDCVCQLKEIYLKINDRDNYKKQLEKLLFDCDYPDIEYYKEYRELFNDWDERREEVFNKINNSSFLNECYNEEKLYDRLVLNIKDQFELSRYKNILKDKYPEELLNAYSEVANMLASKSGNRKHYKKIVKFLKDMKTIDGGDEVVRDILNQWKVKYKRRKAMMEELQYV